MKGIFLLAFISCSLVSFSQIPKSGTYIYKYCDIEYHKCLSTCKIVIKGNHITVYATKELAQQITTREGEILNKGIILKHKSGKWIIGKTQKDKYIEDPFTALDFKKKQYWQF